MDTDRGGMDVVAVVAVVDAVVHKGEKGRRR